MSLVIAMSVYKLREGTKRSIDELLRVARQNPEVNVVVFNKTDEDFLNDIPPTNFNIIHLAPETFGETISRLEVKDDDYVIWCNDDDFFCFDNEFQIHDKDIDCNTVFLSNLEIVSSTGRRQIKWGSLVNALDVKEKYLSYVQIGAPLIFSQIPSHVFNRWISYVKKMPVQMPYIDLQLNLSCLFANQFEENTHFQYTYDESNWTSPSASYSTMTGWTKYLGLSEVTTLSMNTCRMIEDIVFVSSLSEINKKERLNLIGVLLRQFSFVNPTTIPLIANTLRGRIFVYLYYRSPRLVKRVMRMIFLRHFSTDSVLFGKIETFEKSMPRFLRDRLTGVVEMRTILEFKRTLEHSEIQRCLGLPSSYVDFWLRTLVSSDLLSEI